MRMGVVRRPWGRYTVGKMRQNSTRKFGKKMGIYHLTYPNLPKTRSMDSQAGIHDIAFFETRRLWSLWDMLELKSANFIRATQGLSALSGGLTPLKERFNERNPIGQEAVDSVRPEAALLRDVLRDLEAPITLKALERFLKLLDETGAAFPFGAFFFWLAN